MNSSKTSKILIIVTIIMVALFSLLISIKTSKESSNASKANLSKIDKKIINRLNPLEIKIVDRLSAFEVPKGEIKITFLIETGIKEIKAYIPKGIPMEEVISLLSQSTDGTSYSIIDTYYIPKLEKTKITFKSSRKNRETIILYLRRGKKYLSHSADIAIIVSGFEKLPQNKRVTYLDFKEPLNYILPAWDSTFDSTAYILNRYKNGIIVKIPMESNIKRETILSDYTLLLNDSEKAIELKLSGLFRVAPFVSAIATNGGELILESKTIANSITNSIKKRDLLFFDMRKTTGRMVDSLCHKKKILYFKGREAKRDRSIDDYKKLLKSSVIRALHKRRQIIYVEATDEFIKALQETLPYFKDKGIHLITINDIKI